MCYYQLGSGTPKEADDAAAIPYEAVQPIALPRMMELPLAQRAHQGIAF